LFAQIKKTEFITVTAAQATLPRKEKSPAEARL